MALRSWWTYWRHGSPWLRWTCRICREWSREDRRRGLTRGDHPMRFFPSSWRRRPAEEASAVPSGEAEADEVRERERRRREAAKRARRADEARAGYLGDDGFSPWLHGGAHSTSTPTPADCPPPSYGGGSSSSPSSGGGSYGGGSYDGGSSSGGDGGGGCS